MRRPAALATTCGIVGVLGCIALYLDAGVAMPSYLAIWLFWMALPLGALPIVMAADLVGAAGAFVLVLRRMLLLVFPAAVLAVPLMLRLGELYGRPGGLPAAWMAPRAFLTRMVALLVVWCLMALLFSVPPRAGRRAGLAMIGLMLHVCMASLAAVDWVMSLQPGLSSSAFGLLLVASQMAVAASAGLLVLSLERMRVAPAPARVRVVPVQTRVVLVRGRRPLGGPTPVVPAQARVVLACVLGFWLFVHLMQYLVVWSANLPNEIVWYQLRASGLGEAAIWLAAACTLAALLLLPAPPSRLPLVSACCGGALLVVQLLGMLWLVTPVFRGGFLLTVADGFAVAGLGGLAAALLAVALPRNLPREASHEAA